MSVDVVFKFLGSIAEFVIVFVGSARQQFVNQFENVGVFMEHPALWMQEHSLLVLSICGIFWFCLVKVKAKRLHSKLKKCEGNKAVLTETVEDLKERAREFMALKRNCESLTEEISALRVENEQLQSEEEMRRKRLVPVVKTALEEYFEGNTSSLLTKDDIKIALRDMSTAGEVASGDGVTARKAFSGDDIVSLKAMMGELGSKVTIGPEDDGQALAQNISKILIPEIVDKLVSGLEKAVQNVNAASTTASDAEVVADSIATRCVDKLSETFVQPEDVALSFEELVSQLKKHLENIGQQIFIIDGSKDKRVIGKLIDGDIDTLMAELSEKLRPLNMRVSIINDDDTKFIPKDSVELLEIAQGQIEGYFIYISTVEIDNIDFYVDNLMTIEEFKTQQRR